MLPIADTSACRWSLSGSFRQTGENEFVFDNPGSDKELGAVFKIRNNPGFDFDPLGVECKRNVLGNLRPDIACMSATKQVLTAVDSGPVATVSSFKSRMKMFGNLSVCIQAHIDPRTLE